MTRQFVPLTAEQLASAENGDLKLEYRDGGKVMQLVWLKEPYDQSMSPIITVRVDGQCISHKTSGEDALSHGLFDIFVCEEQPAKYGGMLTGVPVEIVEFMLDQQEAQGNKRDISVFEEGFRYGMSAGGFDWVGAGLAKAMREAYLKNYEPMLEYLRKLKDDEGHKQGTAAARRDRATGWVRVQSRRT